MSPRLLTTLALKELRDALSNKWVLLFTIAFAALALGLAALARASAGMTGFAGFGRTAASLVNLVLLLTPLMALSVGATCIVTERERGMLGYLLAQPVSRTEVFLAKYIGLALAMTAAVAVGFGVSAIAMSGAGDGALFLRLAALSALLAWAMLAVGVLVSVVLRRTGSAVGVAVFIWLTLALLADVGIIGAALTTRLRTVTIFSLTLVNPLQAFKMASLAGFGAGLDVLGPAGVWATTEFGRRLPILLYASLLAWIVLPLLAAWVAFRRRPL
ncbi:MAG: ABC transporter permease [Planctomycetota bacterium]|nr:MAG: ABC transporter permease [Planctomycetota bacterium]